MKKYLQHRAKGLSKKEAALKAGYSKKTATNVKHGIENLKSFQELAEFYLPKDKILSVVQEGLQADMVKTATNDGKITDERTYADYSTRARFADIAIKIHGDYAAEKRNLEVTVKPRTTQELLAALQEVANQEGITLEQLCEKEGINI